MPISTNGVVITRVAGALYGEYLSNASYAEVSTTAPATVAANWLTNDFAGKTDMQVATSILKNLGLTSITGLDNWLSAQLTAAGSSAAAKGAALVSILNGYANMTTDATYGSYAVGFNAKVDASLALSQTAGSKGGSFATADVVAITNGSFTLTTGVDVKTGGAGNDIFDGSLSTTNMTLNNFDVLDGAAGTDTLSAVINAASTYAPTLKSIENVSTQFTAAGTLSLANATGVNSVENTNSTDAAIFSNISSTAVALKDTGTAQNVTYGFTAAAVAGTADVATLTLSNTTGGTVTISGVETVNIVSADAPNTIAASGIAATSVKVSGTQTTALGTLNATVATLDASAATNTFSATLGAVAAATVIGAAGNDTIDVSSVTGTVNVSTGNGNDKVTATSNLLASDTINGGDGTDTLVATIASVDTTATATAFTNVSNFETLEISTALANTLTTARVQGGLSQVTLAQGGTGTINLEAGARTVRLGAALTNSLTVNDTGIATNDTLSLTNGASATNVGNSKALTIGGFETTTITTTGSGAAASQVFGAIGITPDVGGSATLNLAGSNSIQIGAVTATSASSLTIDASGLTGTAAATIAAPVRATITTGATNIIGSANADTITASNDNTTIDGGAGNDGITAGTGVDSIAGGLGDDTFTFAGNLTASDSINGGAGNDILSITATSTDVDYTNISAVEVLNVAGTLTATLDTKAAAAGINRVQYGAVGTVETVTVAAGFTNDLTIVQAPTGNQDNEIVSAAAYTKNLTIQTAHASGLAGTFTGGTGTADRIVYDLSAAGITQAGAAGITAIESITTIGSGANNLSVTLDNANIALNATLTIDGSALTSGGALTVVGTAEQDGKLVVIGGTSADSITGTASLNGDNLSGGDGNDTFTMAGNLTTADTISGGNGTDVITVSSATVDSAFTNVTSVESITATAALTLGALGKAAGITTVSTAATTTVGSGFTAPLSVTLANAGVASVSAAAYTNALTVTTSNTATGITATDTITGGTGTSDRLVFNATGAAVVETSADLANVSAIETFAVTGSTVNAVTITLNSANVAAGKSLTLDGSNLTTGVLTVDATNETDGSVIVLGGSANDDITGSASTLGDNLSGGAGDDTFKFATANLTSADTISGGAGNDTLSISNASTLTDASFTSITSVETLTQGANNANQTITLGALANASGLTTITGNGSGVDTVTVGAGFTNALRINIGTGNDAIDASASSAAINVRESAASIDANDVLKGGTSTGDVLTLTADNNGTGANISSMTGFETINVVANATATHDIIITMGANNTQIAAGKTLTVNATALTDTGATLTFAGTASETDGSLSVTGGNGNDTITGGGFTDTLSGGIGTDRLTGGLNADVLTGGAGADTFVYTSASVADSNSTTFDSITDWTSGTDKLEVTLDYSASVSSVTVDANRSSTAVVAGVTAAQDTLSGARGQYVYDTTNSVLLINVNNDNLITTSDFRIGLNAGSTAKDTVVDGDINFVIKGSNTAADTINGGAGADTIDGGAGTDSITGNAGSDSITGGEGADTINGGAGNDAIILTENAAAADVVIFAAAASNGIDIVTDFAAGAGVDIVQLVAANTTATTAAGNTATYAAHTVVTPGAAQAYSLAGADIDGTAANNQTFAGSDIIELVTDATMEGYGDLSAATNGSELFKLLGTGGAGGAATGITVATAGDKAYIVAYDGGKAYLYEANSGADTTISAAEITLVGVFNTITRGDFATGDFTV